MKCLSSLLVAIVGASVAFSQDTSPRTARSRGLARLSEDETLAAVRGLDAQAERLGSMSMRVRFRCEFSQRILEPASGGLAYAPRTVSGTLIWSVSGTKRAARYEFHVPEGALRQPFLYRQVIDDGVKSVCYYATGQALIRPSTGRMNVFPTPFDIAAPVPGMALSGEIATAELGMRIHAYRLDSGRILLESVAPSKLPLEVVISDAPEYAMLEARLAAGRTCAVSYQRDPSGQIVPQQATLRVPDPSNPSGPPMTWTFDVESIVNGEAPPADFLFEPESGTLVTDYTELDSQGEATAYEIGPDGSRIIRPVIRGVDPNSKRAAATGATVAVAAIVAVGTGVRLFRVAAAGRAAGIR